MMARSHIAIGLLGCLDLNLCHILPLSFELFAGGYIGSLAPDIDTPYSSLGSRMPFFSNYLFKEHGHRTLTHALPGIIIISLLASISAFYLPLFGIGLIVGYLLHIFADLCTKEGCALLYPWRKKRYRFLKFVKTGGILEIFIALLLCIGLLGLGYTQSPEFFNIAQDKAKLQQKIHDLIPKHH